MNHNLKPGLHFEFSFPVPDHKTVPHLFPEADEFQMMPRVLATGFMVGAVEWACIKAVNPYIDWPRMQTVGTRVDLTHVAPTPPGLTITVKGELRAVEGRSLFFTVSADDGVDEICSGTHERSVIDAERFSARVAKKAKSAPRSERSGPRFSARAV